MCTDGGGAHGRSTWGVPTRLNAFRAAHADTAAAFERGVAGGLPDGWEAVLPTFTAADGAMATRDAGGKVIAAICDVVPNLVGGSADLDPSTRTAMKEKGDFESPLAQHVGAIPPTQGQAGGVWGYAGRNIHFGIREHGMCAIMNGISYHGIFRASGATFLVFADYCRASIRLAALSRLPNIYIFTHDSIGVGEDGPTHQPVETVSSLRLIRHLDVIRPADPEETAGAFVAAVQRTDGPTLLSLTRQVVPILNEIDAKARREGVVRGGYVAKREKGKLDLIILSCGSELQHALAAANALGDGTRVASMPCFERFERASEEYRKEVLPKS